MSVSLSVLDVDLKRARLLVPEGVSVIDSRSLEEQTKSIIDSVSVMDLFCFNELV